MSHPISGMFYLRSALSLAIGIGSAVGGSFVVSRIKEKQAVEERLNRMEQIVEKLAATKAPADEAKPAPKRTRKTPSK